MGLSVCIINSANVLILTVLGISVGGRISLLGKLFLLGAPTYSLAVR